MHKFPWILLSAIALAACAAPPRGEAPPAAEPPVGRRGARGVATAAQAWTVVASHLAVRVYRDGPMQKLGHDHLITSDGLVGRIALGEPLTETALRALACRSSRSWWTTRTARAAAGGIFAAPVPQKDRDATRHNMLGAKLLDAATPGHDAPDGGIGHRRARHYEARVRVSLAGRESVVAAPFTVTVEGDRLEAHADFRLTHADLGLEPFTVALGALRVRDDFDVDLTLEARRGS